MSQGGAHALPHWLAACPRCRRPPRSTDHKTTGTSARPFNSSNSSNSSSVRAACAHPLAESLGLAARLLFPFARIAASGIYLGVLSRTGSFPGHPLNAIGPQRCRWRRTTPWARRQSATGALFYQLMYPGGIPGHYLSITAGVLTYRAPSEPALPRGLSSSGHCPPSRFASSLPSAPTLWPPPLYAR